MRLLNSLLVAGCFVSAGSLAVAEDLQYNFGNVASGNVISGDFSVFAGLDAWSGFHTESFGIVGGQARIHVPAGDNFAMQVDAAFAIDPKTTIPTTGTNNVVYDSASHVGGHLLYRDPGKFQAGIYGGLSASILDSGEAWSGNTIGLEGQVYIDDMATIWGQLGIINQTEGGWENITLVGARGGARYFFNENVRLDVDGGYSAGDFDGDRASITSWGAGVEYLTAFGSTPMSLLARYDGTYYNFLTFAPTAEMTNHAFRVGVNFKLGTGTLLNQDRNGPNTDLNFAQTSILDATY